MKFASLPDISCFIETKTKSHTQKLKAIYLDLCKAAHKLKTKQMIYFHNFTDTWRYYLNLYDRKVKKYYKYIGLIFAQQRTE